MGDFFDSCTKDEIIAQWQGAQAEIASLKEELEEEAARAEAAEADLQVAQSTLADEQHEHLGAVALLEDIIRRGRLFTITHRGNGTTDIIEPEHGGAVEPRTACALRLKENGTYLLLSPKYRQCLENWLEDCGTRRLAAHEARVKAEEVKG